MELLLEQAKGWGKDFFKGYYYSYCETNYMNLDKLTTVINGLFTYLMIAANVGKINRKTFQKDFGFGYVNLIIENAKKARKL